MEVLLDLIREYGEVAMVFIVLGMVSCIWVMFRRMDEHEDMCERYRSEMRTELKHVRAKISEVDAHVRGDLGELKGLVKLLSSDFRNSNGGQE